MQCRAGLSALPVLTLIARPSFATSLGFQPHLEVETFLRPSKQGERCSAPEKHVSAQGGLAPPDLAATSNSQAHTSFWDGASISTMVLCPRRSSSPPVLSGCCLVLELLPNQAPAGSLLLGKGRKGVWSTATWRKTSAPDSTGSFRWDTKE